MRCSIRRTGRSEIQARALLVYWSQRYREASVVDWSSGSATQLFLKPCNTVLDRMLSPHCEYEEHSDCEVVSSNLSCHVLGHCLRRLGLRRARATLLSLCTSINVRGQHCCRGALPPEVVVKLALPSDEMPQTQCVDVQCIRTT